MIGTISHGWANSLKLADAVVGEKVEAPVPGWHGGLCLHVILSSCCPPTPLHSLSSCSIHTS